MAKRTSSRGAKVTSRKPAAAEVEVLDADDGVGIEMGIVVVTAIVLVIAILLVDKMQATMGSGGFIF